MNIERVYPPFTKVDRAGWPKGEWSIEPDRVEWRMYGFYCMVNRNPSWGTWCGYVALPKGHRYYEVRLNQELTDSQVHGGISWAQKWDDSFAWQFPIKDVWVVGFDCGHDGVDYRPNSIESMGDTGETYKTLAFAIQNTHILLKELIPLKEEYVIPSLTVTVVDNTEVVIAPHNLKVTGDGASMWKDCIRGCGNVGITLDWIEDHPEYMVPQLGSVSYANLIQELRNYYRE